MKNVRQNLAFVCVCVSACVSLTMALAAAPPLRFSLPMGDNAVNRDRMKKSLDHLFGLLKTKTGVDVVLDEVYAYTIARQKGLPGHVIRMSAYREKLRTGKTDMIGLTAEEYFTEDWLRKSVDPYLSWSVMNKKTGREDRKSVV